MVGIELWSVRLEAPDEVVESLFALLSEDEQARARRFVTRQLSTRWTIARAALRLLLARRVGRDPRELAFDYGHAGKPSLRDAPTLSFNLSHSSSLAVYAIADGPLDLGIDVEEIRPMPDRHALARRFFAPGEAEALASVDEPLQNAAFFACWTRKEAYLKARGDGLPGGLASFEVTLRPDDPPGFVRVSGDDWRVHSFVPADGYVAALVHRGEASVGEVRELIL